jgi:gamma-glutamyltranspeptidase/glutathione hydrolase
LITKQKKISGINGSGRCPQNLTLDSLKQKNITQTSPWEPQSPLTITVPGAAAGWVDSIERFGSKNLSLLEILQPAINLAREGYPVSEITAFYWKVWKHIVEGNKRYREDVTY